MITERFRRGKQGNFNATVAGPVFAAVIRQQRIAIATAFRANGMTVVQLNL